MNYSRRQLEALGEPLGDSVTQSKLGGGYIAGGGGSSAPAPAPTSQTVTNTSIPEYAQPYAERLLGKAETTTNAPYEQYKGDRIAGFTPLQEQAQSNIAGMQPSAQLGQEIGRAHV